MDLLSSLIVGLCVAVGVTILIVGIRARNVLLRPMTSEPVDLMDVPRAFRAILDIGRRWLLPRGFRYVSSWKTQSLLAEQGDHGYLDVYLKDSTGTFAVVSPREQPRPGDATAIEFQSAFEDGTLLSTVNRYRHAIIARPPGVTTDDYYVADLDEALKKHEARASARGVALVSDPATRDRVANAVRTSYVDNLVGSGKATRDAQGETHLTLLAAFAYAAQLLFGNWRAALVTPKPLVAGTAADHSQLRLDTSAEAAADLQAYRTRRATFAAMKAKGKWKFTILSGIAFIAIGSWLWDPQVAVFLLGVIAFHEGGHYLAMRLIGYRNVNVFFVPGLGGLATGEKQDATVMQKVIMYLAGPVPGIFLGTAGLIAVGAGQDEVSLALSQLFTIMLVVNVINLLPIIPLDGGRVLEVLLFARWPTLRFLFAAVSGVLLVLVGLLGGETVMLVIGVLIVLSLPTQWGFSRLALRVKRDGATGVDEETAARRVFRVLAMKPFNKWNFQRRATAADELIAEMRTPRPTAAVIALGLAGYVACFVAPALGAFFASAGLRETVATLSELRENAADFANDPGTAEMMAAYKPRDWPAEIEGSRKLPDEPRLALLVEASEAGFIDVSDPQGKQHFAELRRLAEALPRGNAVRGRALLIATDFDEPAEAERAKRLNALLDEFRDATGEGAIVKARTLSSLAPTLAPAERVQMLTASRDLLRADSTHGAKHLPMTWRYLAQERTGAGDIAGADEEWRALLAWYDANPSPDYGRRAERSGTKVDYMTFLLRQRRFQEADALVRPDAEKALAERAQGKRMDFVMVMPSFQALTWLAVQRRDAAEAKKWLDAWQATLRPAATKRDPRYGLARLAVADVANDAAAISAAKSHLMTLPGRPALCEAKLELPAIRDTELVAAGREVSRRYAVCT